MINRTMDELIRELKQQGVLKSAHVEAAFRAIDRKDFVRPEQRDGAYANHPLPIGGGQTISQPYTVAFLLDRLDPRPGEKVLDVGAGSGWTTALLAHIVSQHDQIGEIDKSSAGGGLGKIDQVGQAQRLTKRSDSPASSGGKVFAMERIPELCESGKANVRKYDYIKKRVVKFFCQDGTDGLPAHAPFDKILASAASSRAIPAAWREQLAVGGSMVAPVGGSIWHYRKITPHQWAEREYSGFAFVPLVSETPQAKTGDRKGTHGGAAFNLIVAVLAVAFFILYVTLVPVRLGAGRTRLAVPPGSGSRAIGEFLQSQGIVRSKWAFVTYATLTGNAAVLKPGSYEFGGQTAIPEVVRALVRGGQDPNERSITILEGWDLRDIGAYFEREGLFPAGEWWAAAGLPAHDYRRDRPPTGGPLGGIISDDIRNDFSFLDDAPELAGLEGYLYPDTYRVFQDATPAEVLSAMLSNFGQKLDPGLRGEIARQGRTIFEVVTIASILEKESPHEQDRRVIAGILWKRLERGMPLQVDASVNYITGEKATPSAADLAIDSPYNTYRYPGLPLGPIANPGIAAIRDAIHPEPSAYLYYLTAPSGQTIFSRTLAEHGAAKNRYLR